MTDDRHDRSAEWAVILLAIIALAGIAGGIAVAYLGAPVGAVIAVATGAIGGIVAIVLRRPS